MNLTNNQLNTLKVINEQKKISVDSLLYFDIHMNTINSLYKKELINMPLYANGEFINLTDKGLNIIKNMLS